MKITGGLAKGIPLKISGSSIIRPATDALRQSIFSFLFSSIGNFEDTIFLDLFAGTGAYGLEAWSRGAQGGYFVEKDRKSVFIINENIAAVAKSLKKDPSVCHVIQGDVFKNPIPANLQFDFIFADPPYDILEEKLQDLLDIFPLWLKKDPSSRLILEGPAHLNIPEQKNLSLIRKLGKTGYNAPAAFIFVLRS